MLFRVLILAQMAFLFGTCAKLEAQNHIWGSTTSSSWTTAANWTGGVPSYGGTNGRLDLRSNIGLIHDPLAQGFGAAQTIFNVGRGLVIANTTAGSLTISSGRIRLENNVVDPLNSAAMANYGSASLLINGTGQFDGRPNVNDFLFYYEGTTTDTSTLTVDGINASFASRGFNLRRANGGTATVNLLNGGVFHVDRVYLGGGTGDNVLNFNGGILRAGASSVDFLGVTGTTTGTNLANTTANILNGGALIDTNGFDIGIGQALLAAAGSSGGITKTGLGKLTLSGANTYTGATQITGGTLVVTRNQALGTNANGTTVNGSGTLQLANVNYNSSESLTLGIGSGENGRGSLQGATGISTFAGSISVNNSRIGVQDGASLTLSGNITGANLTLRHAAAGAASTGNITLTGGGNTWTGNTDVEGSFGAVFLSANNAVSSNSVLRLGNGTVGGRLEINGRTQTIRGLSQVNNSTLGVINNLRPVQTLTLSNMTQDQVYQGQISGNINLTLNSTGRKQTLSGNNNYNGTTNITNGVLIVDGNHTAGGAYTVSTNGTLGGAGAIQSAVNVSGTIQAGDTGRSIARLQTGRLQLNNGSRVQSQIETNSNAADLIHVTTGGLSITNGARLEISDLDGRRVHKGTKFSLISYNGGWNGGLFTFGGNLLANNSELIVGLNTWFFRYNDTVGGSNSFAGASGYVTIEAVPEPTALMLVGCTSMLVAVFALRRRRLKNIEFHAA